MTRWEYKEISPNDIHGAKFPNWTAINEAGDEGWEMVSFASNSGLAVFKRPIAHVGGVRQT